MLSRYLECLYSYHTVHEGKITASIAVPTRAESSRRHKVYDIVPMKKAMLLLRLDSRMHALKLPWTVPIPESRKLSLYVGVMRRVESYLAR